MMLLQLLTPQTSTAANSTSDFGTLFFLSLAVRDGFQSAYLIVRLATVSRREEPQISPVVA